MATTSVPHHYRLLSYATLVLSATLVASAGQVEAQDFGPEEEQTGLNFVLGGGVFYSPVYEGSDEYEISALPFFLVTYGSRATVDIGGIQYDFYERGPWTLTGGIGFDFGRKEEDSPDLKGLGDVDSGVNLSFGLDYALGQANVFADIERTFGGSDGLVGKIGAEYSQPVGQVMIGASVTATVADDNYMQSYFGVTAAQSAASGLAQYEANAGLKRVDAELSATYFISDSWMLRGTIGVGELLGDATDSPIVKDTTQSSTAMFVAFRF